MIQKQIEQTRVIAEKDGWRFRNNGGTAELFTNGEFVMGCHGWKETPDFPIHKYLTDLNSLHRVAMDVMGELSLMWFEADTVANNCTLYDEMLIKKQELEIFKTPLNCTRDALTKRPINGEYIDLFNAVYDGIVFLNENKTEAND